MPRKAGATIYVATQSFSTTLNGVPVHVTAGVDHVREGHPLLAGREHMFKPMTITYDVEQATAEPGKKRGE